jgi:cytoskeletal protein RodZ
MGFWQENKVPLAIVFGALIIGGFVFFSFAFYSRRQVAPAVPSNPPSPATEFVSPAPPSPTASPTVAPTPTETEPASSPTLPPAHATSPSPTAPPELIWKKSDLIKALSEKTGIPEAEVVFSVGDQVKESNRLLLRGGVSRQGETGGAAFFAVVDENGTKVTFAGQGVPACSEVNPYNYPLSWADYCVNSQGDTVAR